MQGESSESRVEAQGPSSCYERALTDHYRVLSAIGEGRYGQVVLARHLLTWTEVAVKVVPKTERKERTLCEREGLMALEHRNMIQLFQVIETPDNMYLVMEHAGGGTLQHHIPQPGGLPEEKVRRVFRAMVCVLHHCHQQGFVHLDVKPQNFLVDTSGHHLKLIDFGLCMSFTPGQKLKEFRGTLPYCAPEILKRKELEAPPPPPTPRGRLEPGRHPVFSPHWEKAIQGEHQEEPAEADLAGKLPHPGACVPGSAQPHPANPQGGPQAEAHPRAGNGAPVAEPG
ncbi:Hypothetical predicted protein [Marmota monax]|uniref:non-specific serine/threonine protein kinase n=1 Tax=Marmota monax TaxID=9995 RepID=A0A5E4AUY4_MARMO|nr:hypothetical protein GHT09_010056 [Marmota monax]VTJ61283.1 Hypothetical predicted protein [Marmota monax]